MTNELGRRIAEWRMALFDDASPLKGITLGAYRAGKHMPWVPGAEIDAWAPCARPPSSPDVPWPHCYFVQTQGGSTENDRSIYCPTCRVEVAALRAAGVKVSAPARPAPVAVAPSPPVAATAQSDLPF